MSFLSLCKSLPPADDSLITPFWKERIGELERDFGETLPPNFLQQGTIAYTMFVQWCGYSEIEYREMTGWGVPSLNELLSEPDAGMPVTHNIGGILTSGNTVHHAYHWARWLRSNPGQLPAKVVEFGAGYGNMARLYMKFPHREPWTYVCIDLPVLTCLQFEYLNRTIGEERVNLVSAPDGCVAENKVNLVPLSLIDTIGEPAELFVSTWGISESPKKAQDLISEHRYFGCEHFLLAGQGSCAAFPCASDIEYLVGGLRYEEIAHIPGNFYALK